MIETAWKPACWKAASGCLPSAAQYQKVRASEKPRMVAIYQRTWVSRMIRQRLPRQRLISKERLAPPRIMPMAQTQRAPSLKAASERSEVEKPPVEMVDMAWQTA